MGNRIVRSFSFSLKDVVTMTQAEDIAKQEGKSLSEFLVDLVKAECKKQSQKEHQQNNSVIAILNNGQQLSIEEFIPRLYENKIEKEQQFQWIKQVDNGELIEFTNKLKETHNMIKHRRFSENLVAQRNARDRALKTVIPPIDKLVQTSFGLTTNNKDKSIPNELDDIPIAEE
jgi:predicted CopG family antitoxin